MDSPTVKLSWTTISLNGASAYLCLVLNEWESLNGTETNCCIASRIDILLLFIFSSILVMHVQVSIWLPQDETLIHSWLTPSSCWYSLILSTLEGWKANCTFGWKVGHKSWKLNLIRWCVTLFSTFAIFHPPPPPSTRRHKLKCRLFKYHNSFSSIAIVILTSSSFKWLQKSATFSLVVAQTIKK